MLSRPRGHCLLINNVDAFKTMPSRQGSDIDGSKLKSLFCQLGFEVILRRNLIYTVSHSFPSRAQNSCFHLGNGQCNQKFRDNH